MADFCEVIKDFNRMCSYYQRKLECPMKCPMDGMNISQCRKLAFEKPEDTELRVRKWYKEHPEMEYPTWKEYLISIGIISYDDFLKPIPESTAIKLGLRGKPKRKD